jgi:hypothetical protein
LRIKLLLFGPYARLLPLGTEGSGTVVDAAEGATVLDVLDAVAVPDEGRRFVTVNGVRSDMTARLRDDDEVRVIVPLGGG